MPKQYNFDPRFEYKGGLRNWSRLWWLAIVFLVALVLYFPEILSRGWLNVGQVVLMRALTNGSEAVVANAAMQAESLLDRAVAYAPESHSAWRGLGFALAAQGREDEAMAAWQLVPEMGTALAHHGWEAQTSGRYQEALVWYGRATRIAPEVADQWLYQIGLTYKGANNLEKALLAFQRANELFPDNRNICYQLGIVYAWRRELKQALDVWHKCVDASTGYIGLSNLYYQIGRLEHRLIAPPNRPKAWDAYEKALALDDYASEKWQKADTYFQRGAILASQERWSEAVQEYNYALDLDPNHYWAHLALSSMLWQMGETERAKVLMLQAILLEPNRKNAYRLLGDFYKAEGDIDNARVVYGIVLELDPLDREVIEILELLNTGPLY